MRASEFISENKEGDLPISAKRAGKYAIKYTDPISREYQMYRASMASAKHDGKSEHPVKDMTQGSFGGKYNTAHPYTKEESNMIKGALKTVGGTIQSDLISDHKSLEDEDVHKISPVTGFKGYKRN